MHSIPFVIVFVAYFSNVISFDEPLIKHYFSYNHVTLLNIFHCFDKKEEVSFLRKFTTDFNVRSYNIMEPKFINASDIFLKRNIRLGSWMDGTNCAYTDGLQQLSDIQAFRGVHYVFIFMKNIDIIKSAFENITLTVNSNLKIMVEDGMVYDVYNPSTLHGGKLIVSPYMHWNIETRRFLRTNREHLYWTRRNMTGVTFRAMVVLAKQHFPGTLEDYLFNDDDRGVNTLNRYHSVLMQHIRDYYDFQLILSMTNSWGYKQENGTFDGLVRALELRQVDFGSSPLFLKAERWAVHDYGRRTWPLRSSFIFRKPKRPASFEVFFRPLDGKVWYLTVLACIIIVVLLKLSLKVEISQFQHLVETFEPSWSHIALFTLGALCQQGCSTSPDGISSRISFIFIFIFTVLLYQYYSASIVAILLMTPARFINNLHDLVYSTLILASEDVGYHRDYICKMANDSIIGRLIKRGPKGTEASFYLEPEDAMQRVASGGYAINADLATVYPIMAKTFDEDTICSLDEIPFQIQAMNQPVLKGSEFREMLDYVLQRIDETGLMYRQLKHWHAKKPECIRTQPATSSVSIEEFYPALSMLLLGMLCSVGVFILEHIIHIHLDYQERKREEKMIKELILDKKHGRIIRVRQ